MSIINESPMFVNIDKTIEHLVELQKNGQLDDNVRMHLFHAELISRTFKKIAES